MGTITSTYITSVDDTLPEWSASAQTFSPVSRWDVQELLVPWGASVAIAVVPSANTDLSLGEYTRAHPTTTFLQVGFSGGNVVADVRTPQGSWNILDTAASSNTAFGTVRVGLWLRLVRDGDRWGVQLLEPATGAQSPSIQTNVLEWGQAQIRSCDNLVDWVSGGLQTGNATLQVWLRSKGDTVHTIVSGLTGTANPAPFLGWKAQVDVELTGVQSTTAEATRDLTAAAVTTTAGEANPDGVAAATTLSTASVLRYQTAEAVTVSTARAFWLPASVTAVTQTTSVESRATGVSSRIPAMAASAADGTPFGVGTAIPAITIDARVSPAQPSESTVGGVTTDMPPPILARAELYYRQGGDVWTAIPPVAAAAAEGPVGVVDARIPPLMMAAGALATWQTRSDCFAGDRWTLRKGMYYTDGDTVEIVDTSTLGVADQADSTAEVSDSMTWSTARQETLHDSVTVADTTQFSVAGRFGDSLAAWCVNMDTGASSRYTGYGFNSFFELDGVRYGVASDGVYQLDGATDHGVEIDGLIDLGETDFESDRVKYVPKVYFSGKSAWPMHVNVIADSVSRTYAARNQSITLDSHRVDCGVGVKANYWRFTIQNTVGADFSVDAFRATPVVTRRRI